MAAYSVFLFFFLVFSTAYSYKGHKGNSTTLSYRY